MIKTELQTFLQPANSKGSVEINRAWLDSHVAKPTNRFIKRSLKKITTSQKGSFWPEYLTNQTRKTSKNSWLSQCPCGYQKWALFINSPQTLRAFSQPWDHISRIICVCALRSLRKSEVVSGLLSRRCGQSLVTKSYVLDYLEVQNTLYEVRCCVGSLGIRCNIHSKMVSLLLVQSKSQA